TVQFGSVLACDPRGLGAGDEAEFAIAGRSVIQMEVGTATEGFGTLPGVGQREMMALLRPTTALPALASRLQGREWPSGPGRSASASAADRVRSGRRSPRHLRATAVGEAGRDR